MNETMNGFAYFWQLLVIMEFDQSMEVSFRNSLVQDTLSDSRTYHLQHAPRWWTAIQKQPDPSWFRMLARVT